MPEGLRCGNARKRRATSYGNGVEQLALRADLTGLRGIEFSPDGTRLISTADDGMARVWALDLDDLIAMANDRLTRDLEDQECRQYLHLDVCPQSESVPSE